MKYLIILEVAKNRRIFAFLRDLSHKLFGFEMMLLATAEHHAWPRAFSGMSYGRLQ